MLLPRRLALLSLIASFLLLLLIRRSAYRDDTSHEHLPDLHNDDTKEFGQSSHTPFAGKPTLPDSEEEPLHDPSSAKENLEQSETPPVPPKVPAERPTSSDPQALDNAHEASETAPPPQTESVKQYLQEILSWPRPDLEDGHWPKYSDYRDKDYDPNRWEAFPREEGFYTKSGINYLNRSASTPPEPYLPYPDYNSAEWRRQWKGRYHSCEGPRGLPLNGSNHDIVRAYQGPPAGFPEPSIGSFEAIGLRKDVCFDRYSRYGPYGFGEGHGMVRGWTMPEKVSWSGVDWGELQNQCLKRNKYRYAGHARSVTDVIPDTRLPEDDAAFEAPKDLKKPKGSRDEASLSYRSRTAILIRSWEGYSYTDNDMQSIRALITETSLLSGGEYQVFLFVNVKDKEANIYGDQRNYTKVVKRSVPSEFRGITILWSEEVCKQWYPEVTDWQVYWHQWMPVQWFSETHPEFDFIFELEVDARYTGNHYEFLESVASFARNQPRKYLWERNKRFYLPAVHGSYKQFYDDTNAIVANASASKQIAPVWGPQPYLKEQTPIGPKPPTTQDADNFNWGVSEEADLVTLLPIWKPANTSWSYKDKIWNFVKDSSGNWRHPIFNRTQPTDELFTDPAFSTLPRRVSINTVARFSRKLLHAMHLENRAGRTMQAEMWPGTVALHHGLKAVYAPHPVWFDRVWPVRYADLIFNPRGETSGSQAPGRRKPSDPDAAALHASAGEDGVPAAWSERQDSALNHDREFQFWGWSWYYRSRFPGNLYRRWLGMKTVIHPWGYREQVVGGQQWEAQHGGRMCLPPMLLHPVKSVKEGEIWDEWSVR